MYMCTDIRVCVCAGAYVFTEMLSEVKANCWWCVCVSECVCRFQGGPDKVNVQLLTRPSDTHMNHSHRHTHTHTHTDWRRHTLRIASTALQPHSCVKMRRTYVGDMHQSRMFSFSYFYAYIMYGCVCICVFSLSAAYP